MTAFEHNVFHREIQARINEFHNIAARNPIDTWIGLCAEITSNNHRQALEQIKEVDSDNQGLYQLYDDLEKSGKAAIDELNRMHNENAILAVELERQRQLNEQLRASDIRLLNAGTEPDCYPNEAVEIIVDVLRKQLAGTAEMTRRYDVISSVIEANPVQGKPHELSEAVKRILKGCKTFTSSMISDLKELGIDAEKLDGNHYALVYYNNPRYKAVGAST